MVTVIEKIPVGSKNAVPASTLSIMLGCRGKRELRTLIRSLRKSGVPICSGDSGYFIPENREEAYRCIERLKTHGAEEIQMARAIETAVSELDGQLAVGISDGNVCVCCGQIIPEGRQVCVICERRVNASTKPI